jgi:hypothetical protein
MRNFDEAQRLYEDLAGRDPHRLEVRRGDKGWRGAVAQAPGRRGCRPLLPPLPFCPAAAQRPKQLDATSQTPQPHPTPQGMDAYSNILYVKEAFAGLSHLAHRVAADDKYRPEACVIIGNYYSLKVGGLGGVGRGGRVGGRVGQRRASSLATTTHSRWGVGGGLYSHSHG